MKIAIGNDHAAVELKLHIKEYLEAQGHEVIAANKVRGARCACVSEPVSAQMCRAHNDCNLIAFGARIVGPQLAEAIVDQFLTTPFEGGRHARRVEMIMNLDERQSCD